MEEILADYQFELIFDIMILPLTKRQKIDLIIFAL